MDINDNLFIDIAPVLGGFFFVSLGSFIFGRLLLSVFKKIN
tara:strand:- start:178 stop:300 length:123 start_codon:yes stop_codon:yes gene_type:complete